MEYISVIIPAYNAEKYIRECLDSVIHQSLKQLEIIVVNDGSTDHTESIIKEYSDERLKLISVPNSGVSHARNVGIESAKGKYIMFQDADDILHENACEVMYHFAEQNNLDIVRGGYSEFKGTCAVLPVNKEPAFIIYTNKEMQKNYLTEAYYWGDLDSLDGINTGAVWGGLYKSAILEEMRFNETLSIGEDTTFNYDLFYRHMDQLKVGVLKEIFYYYRRGTEENSGTRNNQEKAYKDHVVQKLAWLKVLEKCDIKDASLMKQYFNVLTFRLYNFFEKEERCSRRIHQKNVMDVWRKNYCDKKKRALLSENLPLKFKIYYSGFHICPGLMRLFYKAVVRTQAINALK